MVPLYGHEVAPADSPAGAFRWRVGNGPPPLPVKELDLRIVDGVHAIPGITWSRAYLIEDETLALVDAGLRSTVPPFFTRFGLWVGFFLVTGIMIRFAMRAVSVWSTLNPFEAYVACMALGLMALGVVRFQLLLRLPEIRRTVDADEGAIL